MGSGSSQEDHWVFGFGSNMNLNALKHKRVTPLKSHSGKLKGMKCCILFEC